MPLSIVIVVNVNDDMRKNKSPTLSLQTVQFDVASHREHSSNIHRCNYWHFKNACSRWNPSQSVSKMSQKCQVNNQKAPASLLLTKRSKIGAFAVLMCRESRLLRFHFVNDCDPMRDSAWCFSSVTPLFALNRKEVWTFKSSGLHFLILLLVKGGNEFMATC